MQMIISYIAMTLVIAVLGFLWYIDASMEEHEEHQDWADPELERLLDE